MNVRVTIAAAAAATLAAAHAPALAGCAEDDVMKGATGAARVRAGASRTYFVQDAAAVPGCPDATASCRAKAYAVSGDIVLLGGTQGSYACAAFTSPRGVTTAGWMPAAALAPLPADAAGLDGWTGTWTRTEARIVIKPAAPDGLSVEGDATWGAGDPERVRRGGVNMGDISARVQPAGDTLSFTVGTSRTLAYDQGDDTDCRARMVRRGPYLVVRDNMGCGGMNVTFSGIYRRRE